MKNETRRREISFIKGPNGEVVAVRARNCFRTRASSQEKAHEMVSHPDGIHRLRLKRRILVIDGDYLRGVRELDPSARVSHLEFIASSLREAREVVFQPRILTEQLR